MHIASAREPSSDSFDIVRLLLEHNANPNIVCNGQTPLSLAFVNGNEQLVDLFLQHEQTDPSVPLGIGNGNVLCLVLSTLYEPRWNYAKRIQLVNYFSK